jgi:ATP phosphoribosyltransferase regulatory subunit
MAVAPLANFEALEAQARTLLAVFIAAGHEAVAPPIIQPAGVFLDVLGESLRGRTYVFTDLNGRELCLRPDLTADARTLTLVLTALSQAGLSDWSIRIGDLALFDAVLAAADIPDRWRRRLRHQFWRPDAFRAEL